MKFETCALCLLVVLTTLMLSGAALETRSTQAQSRTEGQLPESNSTYVRFKGTDGLELELTMPRERDLDYTVMFSFRSSKSFKQLVNDAQILNKRAYLFDLPGAAACWITRSEKVEPWLECSPGTTMKISLAALPDVQAWMHLTYSAKFVAQADGGATSSSSAYVKIDSVTKRGDYTPLKDRRAYVSCGFDYQDGQGYREGFPGDYRQFWFAIAYVEPNTTLFLEHQEKVPNYRVRAYYKFDNIEDRYRDAFRNQRARPVRTPPAFINEKDPTSPYCTGLSDGLVQLAKFDNSTKMIFTDLNLFGLAYRQSNFAYTLSMWLQNFGRQPFATDFNEGRTSCSFFEVEGVLSLFWDSPTSFRVYVFALKDYFEPLSDSVYVPLNVWVNVQVGISTEDGVTVMTFNENGDRLQIFTSKLFLGKQYPEQKLHLFKSFSGIPYRVIFWQRKIQLPVPQTEYYPADVEKIVDLDFVKTDAASSAWVSMFGKNLMNVAEMTAAQRSAYSLVSQKIPMIVNYENSLKFGDVGASGTLWNGVSCPSPQLNAIYFNGTGSGVQGLVNVTKTDSYSVEFWYKADPSKIDALNSQNKTYLFVMDNTTVGANVTKSYQAMAIFIERGILKCAPYGVANTDCTLEYGVVNPLQESKWQHISCSFTHQRLVVGHYLAVDLEPNSVIADFNKINNAPQKFSKEITSCFTGELRNAQNAMTWTVTLANVKQMSRVFFGTLKDVRVWTAYRTSVHINQNRFVQINAEEPALMLNWKLNDGTLSVVNTKNQREDPLVPKLAVLVKNDMRNLVCPAEAFFDLRDQICASYPYTSTSALVYTTAANRKSAGSFYTQLTSVVDSSNHLLGELPVTSVRWHINGTFIDSIQSEFEESTSTIRINTSSIAFGAPQNLQFVRLGLLSHNFYVGQQLTFNPQKCVRLADAVSDEPITEKRFVLSRDVNAAEMCFQFVSKSFCPVDASTTPRPQVESATVPQIPTESLSKFKQSFNETAKLWSVCIPAEIIEHDLPRHRTVHIIFTVTYDTAGQQATQMQNMYKVAISEEIRATLRSGATEIDFGSSDSLFVDARDTYFYDNTTLAAAAGLRYRWVCPGALQTWCDRWLNMPSISFPKDVVNSYITINTHYNITVVVSSLIAGQNTALSQPFEFHKSTRHVWTNKSKPKFSLIKLSTPEIRVSENIQFTMLPYNFRLSDPGFQFSFSFEPSESVADDSVRVSAGGTLLTIKPDALRYNKPFKVTISATNTASTEGGTEIQNSFITNQQPQVQSVLVEPKVGKAYVTEFKITISDYFHPVPGSEPLQYMLYGVRSDNSTFRISTEFEYLKETFFKGEKGQARIPDNLKEESQQRKRRTTIQMKLPELKALEVRIRDDSGSTNKIQASVSVAGPTKKPLEYLETLKAQFAQDSVEVWQHIGQFVREVNAKGIETLLSVEEVTKVNMWTVQQVKMTIGRLMDNPDKVKAIAAAQRVIMAFGDSLKFVEFTDDALLKESAAAMLAFQKLISKVGVTSLNGLEQFFLDSASAFVRLVRATSTRANLQSAQKEIAPNAQDPAGPLRRLQSQTKPTTASQEVVKVEQKTEYRAEHFNEELKQSISNAFAAKTDFTDTLCRTVQETGEVRAFLGEGIEFFVRKAKRDYDRIKDHQATTSDGLIQLNLQFDQMMMHHKQNSEGFSWLCAVVTFFRHTPVPKISGTSYMQDQWTVHVSTLDDLGYRMVDTPDGFVSQRGKSVEVYFAMDPKDYATFLNKRTRCMWMKAGSAALDQVWSGEGCSQEVVQGSKSIAIRCDCFSLKDNYYALVSDLSQPDELICTLGADDCYFAVDQNSRKSFRSQAPEGQSSQIITFMLLIPLFLLGTALPASLHFKDKSAYAQVDGRTRREGKAYCCGRKSTSVNHTRFALSPALIEKFVLARGKSCPQEVYYHEPNFSKLMEKQEIGIAEKFMFYTGEVHPFLGAIGRYDYRLSRVERYSFVLGQISLITILIWVAFSKTGVQALGENSLYKSTLVALALSLLTLPLPRCTFKFLETQLQVLVQEDEQKFTVGRIALDMATKKPGAKADEVVNPWEIKLDVDLGDDEFKLGDRTPKVTLMHSNKDVKFAFFFFIYLLWCLAIACTVYAAFFVREINESEWYSSYIELSQREALYALYTWAMATFGFGYLGVNMVRTLLIAVLAPGCADLAFWRYMDELVEGKKKPGDGQTIQRGWKNIFIPDLALEIALDQRFMFMILEYPGMFPPNGQISKPMLFLLKKKAEELTRKDRDLLNEVSAISNEAQGRRKATEVELIEFEKSTFRQAKARKRGAQQRIVEEVNGDVSSNFEAESGSQEDTVQNTGRKKESLQVAASFSAEEKKN